MYQQKKYPQPRKYNNQGYTSKTMPDQINWSQVISSYLQPQSSISSDLGIGSMQSYLDQIRQQLPFTPSQLADSITIKAKNNDVYDKALQQRQYDIATAEWRKQYELQQQQARQAQQQAYANYTLQYEHYRQQLEQWQKQQQQQQQRPQQSGLSIMNPDFLNKPIFGGMDNNQTGQTGGTQKPPQQQNYNNSYGSTGAPYYYGYIDTQAHNNTPYSGYTGNSTNVLNNAGNSTMPEVTYNPYYTGLNNNQWNQLY